MAVASGAISVADGSTAAVVAVADGAVVAVGWLVQAMDRPANATINIANQD
jgi:hypothetical protein